MRVSKCHQPKSNNKLIIIAILIFGAVSVDFITSSLEVMQGTFRYESEFDAISSATVKVGLVPSDFPELASPASRDGDLTYEQVEAMVRKAIDLQGGLEWVVKKGNKVMIKVNLVGANSPSGQGENTDVRVVKSLIKIINEHAEGDVEIVVAEGSARTNDDPQKSGSVWENSGYTALKTDAYLSGINFRFLNLNQTIDDVIEVDLGDEGMSAIQGTVYGVHREELEADVYITVPVLKIHDTGITNALKLQVGSAPGSYYGYNKMAGTSRAPGGLYHDVAHRRWTTEMIVDLSNIADIDFVVVDALMTLETYKTFRGDNQVRMNTIIAGVDPVSVDHVCARLFDLNPDDIAHITLAEKAGLGTNDPQQIIVEGAKIDDVKKRVKKNTSENGKFGQSNRTWILSGPYDGTDIAEEFIENEAEIRPEPGSQDWTEPVYFFDDRIDLYSFYNAKTNMISYAFTNFYAPKDQQAELWFGAQEAVKIYLNGEEVYSSTATKTYGDSDIGSKIKTVQIREGENTLLVKTLNRFGDYSFAINICEPETNSNYYGNRVTGLKFYQGSVDPYIPEEVLSTGEVLAPLKCFPNPATTLLSIAFEKADIVRIVDMQGRSVKNFDAGNQITWDLTNDSGSRVKSGLYFCQIRTGDEWISERVVVR